MIRFGGDSISMSIIKDTLILRRFFFIAAFLVVSFRHPSTSNFEPSNNHILVLNVSLFLLPIVFVVINKYIIAKPTTFDVVIKKKKSIIETLQKII